MSHQIYLQNCLSLLLAAYLIKAVMDPLRVFSKKILITSI